MTFSRAASLLVAAAYLFVAVLIVPRDARTLIPCVLATLLPLPFIWFSEAFGDYTGPGDLGFVNRPTPGPILSLAGWVVLVFVPPILIAVYR